MNEQACPMGKLEKLLLATDGSDYSKGAEQEALHLAKRCSSKLIAVSTVITNLEFEVTMPQVVDKEDKKAWEHLEAFKALASKEGVACDITAFHGEEPYQDIVRHAQESRVDLIVMGRHGRTGLVRLMMGSVAAKVIGHAPCNVLVVPPNARVEFRNILVATDGSQYSEAAIREAIGIAKKCGGSLVAVSVAAAETELAAAKTNVQNVLDAANKEGVSGEAVTRTGKPYEAIVETARQKHADLIIVGSLGRTGLKRLLMGSVTERVIGHTEAGVLVVKAQ